MIKPLTAISSIAAAFATTKIASSISTLQLAQVLKAVGLVRRTSLWQMNLAFFGAGVLAGGVSVLLLAPSSGKKLRAQFGRNKEATVDDDAKDAPDKAAARAVVPSNGETVVDA